MMTQTQLEWLLLELIRRLQADNSIRVNLSDLVRQLETELGIDGQHKY